MSLLTLPKPDAATLGRRDEIIRQLTKLVPDATLIVDQEGRRTYETDALTAYRCMPLAVVLPGSTEEVSKVLRYCHFSVPNHHARSPIISPFPQLGSSMPMQCRAIGK